MAQVVNNVNKQYKKFKSILQNVLLKVDIHETLLKGYSVFRIFTSIKTI